MNATDDRSPEALPSRRLHAVLRARRAFRTTSVCRSVLRRTSGLVAVLLLVVGVILVIPNGGGPPT